MTDKIIAGGKSSSAVKVGINAASVYHTPILVPAAPPIPPWKGSGSLSGTVPYVVTYAGSPAAVTLDLFDRTTNYWIKSTVSSAVDGSFSFTGLNTGRLFDVRARGSGFSPAEDDMIIASVTPA
jgi:hypothetical protein